MNLSLFASATLILLSSSMPGVFSAESSLRGVTQSTQSFNDASNVVPTSNYLEEEEDSYYADADVDMEMIGKGKGGGGGGGKKKGGGGKKKKGGRSGGGKKRSNKRSNRRSRRRSSSSSRSSRSSRSSSSSTSSDFRRSFRSDGLCGRSNMRDSDRELCNRLEDEFCRTSSQRRTSFCRQLGIDFVVSETE